MRLLVVFNENWFYFGQFGCLFAHSFLSRLHIMEIEWSVSCHWMHVVVASVGFSQHGPSQVNCQMDGIYVHLRATAKGLITKVQCGRVCCLAWLFFVPVFLISLNLQHLIFRGALKRCLRVSANHNEFYVK